MREAYWDVGVIAVRSHVTAGRRSRYRRGSRVEIRDPSGGGTRCQTAGRWVSKDRQTDDGNLNVVRARSSQPENLFSLNPEWSPIPSYQVNLSMICSIYR